MTPLADDWLAQLAADHAPPPVGWWPPAPGWWLLGLLLLAAVAGAVWWWRRPARRLRRAALAELARIERTVDEPHLAGALEDLLRRYAIAAYGRAAVARLTGRAWIAFVVARGGDALDGAAGTQLLQAVYAGHGGVAREAWLRGARGFLGHRP